MSKTLALHNLLRDLFNGSELHRFLVYRYGIELAAALPRGDTGLDDFIFQTILLMHRRGALDRQFFDQLQQERPRRAMEIECVMRGFLDELPRGDAPGLPEGWDLAGNTPKHYSAEVCHEQYESLYLRRYHLGDGFGTIMQRFQAKNYRKTRLRLSASIRTNEVRGWVGMWMRIDGRHGVLGFDNMETRALLGTQPWTLCTIVLDVPRSAWTIYFGFLMEGDGHAWARAFRFDRVDRSIPRTGKRKNPMTDAIEPQNLF